MLQSHDSSVYTFVSSCITTSILSVDDIFRSSHALPDLNFIDFTFVFVYVVFVIESIALLIEVNQTLVFCAFLVLSADKNSIF